MNDLDADFKTKFMELVNRKKAEAGKTSSLMRVDKRERIIRCLQNPELEPNVKFRSRVKERKYRLLQQDDEIFLGVPDETSGEVVYRRAACVEEFWEIISQAHVENGHIGVVHTFNAIRGMYALLPRYLVSKYVRMCPVCAHTFRNPHKNRASASATESDSSISATCLQVAQPDAGETAQDSSAEETTILTVDTTVLQDTAVQPEDSRTETPSDVSADTPDSSDVNTDASDSRNMGAKAPDSRKRGADAPSSSDKNHHATPSKKPAQLPEVTPLGQDIKMVFKCHICDMPFDKKLNFQRHIRAHREHNPAIPFVSPYKFSASGKNVKQERRSYTTVSRGRQIIIDGDMGVEACQALMLAVCRSDLVVVGVTCVSGSVSIENACNNALRVLNTCGREDIQVFCGAERPLVTKATHSDSNLPGASWLSAVDTSQIKSEHAVSAMIRLVSEQPGKITLVCLGPLTNLALAMRLDPHMSKKLKEIFILGGNIEGRGDSSICAEQNFHYDPEAAFTVLEETQNITLLPYEVCDRHKLTGEFFDSWVHLGTDKSEFVRGMGDAPWLREHQRNGFTPYCAYAMAAVADRSIALEKKSVYATVELSGTFSRGMMVVDWMKKLGYEDNVDLVRSLDLGKIQSLLIGMVEEAEAMEVYTV